MAVHKRLSGAWILCSNNDFLFQALQLENGCYLRSLPDDDSCAVVLAPLLALATSDWRQISASLMHNCLSQFPYKLVPSRDAIQK